MTALSYTAKLFGSTVGNPNALGSRLPPLPAGAVFKTKGLISPLLMFEASEARTLLMNRMFVPNCRVCFPCVHVTSSTQLCTGTWNFVVNDVCGDSDDTPGTRSSM